MNTLLFRALLLLVILAPLPLGSNREWAWTLAAVIVSVLALAWAVHAAFRPRQTSLSLPVGVTLLFLAVCAWAWMQTLTSIPPDWAHPLWSLNAELLEQSIPASISLAAGDTFTALMRLASYGLVFFLSFQYCRDRARALETFKWLAFAGFAYAIYGLIIFWGEFGTLFWFHDEGFKYDVRGTFVNRNSFATYLGLTLLCAVAVFYLKTAIRRNPAYTTPVGREIRIEQFILQTWKPLVVILLMVTALILTHSRGGFFSTLTGGVILLFALNHRQKIQGVRPKAILGATLAVAVMAFVLTSEVLLQRIDRLTVDLPGRMKSFELTMQGIEDNPALGFGYGTYSDSFRLYRDDRLDVHFDKAHNTYLENIFELGWPAALALFACIAWLAAICVLGIRNRGRDWVFPATGLAATVLVAVHSLFDFSLQMPAVAFSYACLMGVACAQSYSSRGS